MSHCDSEKSVCPEKSCASDFRRAREIPPCPRGAIARRAESSTPKQISDQELQPKLGLRSLSLPMHLLKGVCVMSKQTTSPDFLACIPHVIEPHWDNVWAPRLACVSGGTHVRGEERKRIPDGRNLESLPTTPRRTQCRTKYWGSKVTK